MNNPADGGNTAGGRREAHLKSDHSAVDGVGETRASTKRPTSSAKCNEDEGAKKVKKGDSGAQEIRIPDDAEDDDDDFLSHEVATVAQWGTGVARSSSKSNEQSISGN
jgi:hypothetical protein